MDCLLGDFESPERKVSEKEKNAHILPFFIDIVNGLSTWHTKEVKKIVQKDDPILRVRSQPVPLSDITSENIQNILAGMKAALAAEHDGVALAAPQIGVPLRIFIVSGHVFDPENFEQKERSTIPDKVFINPEITKQSKKVHTMDEGCLSVRHWYGAVKRSEKTTVSAYDETGKKFTYGGSGLLSQIFQHEIDHLNGILFTDKATQLEEIHPHT